jgi:hypothetical protein
MSPSFNRLAISTVVAILFNVIFFSLTLVNETAPILPWIICPVTFLACPLIMAGGFAAAKAEWKVSTSYKNTVKWYGAVGLVIALLLTVVL